MEVDILKEIIERFYWWKKEKESREKGVKY